MHEMESTPEEPKPAPRVSFFTLGCRLNQHDTAAMRADLEREGWRAADPDRADVLIVNTCTVTRRADQEARQLVRRLAAERPGAAIVVTGCYAERASAEVAALPGVAAVVGVAARERIAEALAPLRCAGAWTGMAPVSPAPTPAPAVAARARRPFAASAPLSFGRTRALLKVQDGCDSFCAYCIVPYVRGRSRSLPLAEALARARRLLDADSAAVYATPGQLLFVRQGTLFAQDFDAARLELRGNASPMAERIALDTGAQGSAAVSASTACSKGEPCTMRSLIRSGRPSAGTGAR